MEYILNSYKDKESAKAFVEKCEADFENRLSKAAGSVAGDDRIRLITLAGPTCSGKTTTAKKLTYELERRGKRAKVISIDDFYFDYEKTYYDESTNLESAASIDLDLLSESIQSLLCGKKTMLPKYDFLIRRRINYEAYVPCEEDVFIFEGIQSIYPEIRSLIPSEGFCDIFVNVFEGLNVDGVTFTKDEIRFVRRIVRDFNFRNTKPSGTVTLWNSVRHNEETNIFPYSADSSVKIDSLMPYEIYLMRDIFMPLTEGMSNIGSEYENVFVIREKMKNVPQSAVSPDMLPPYSVYREFIG